MKKKLQRSFLSVTAGMLLLIQNPLNGQISSLIQDINAGMANSSPTLFTSCGLINTIFFVADNGSSGAELWKYDINAGTSTLVKDINPGATGSGITIITANMGNNGILFNANDGVNGNELWKSDGTAAGTSMVLDINPGVANSNPNNFYAFGGAFLFSADNGTAGKEPWITNGNVAGTALLKDINPGANASDPNNFSAVGVKVLFRANDGINGSELWSTDMTANNTSLVKDINPGSTGSVPLNLVTVGGTLFFSANDSSNGVELWKSDGTSAGTSLVKDINPGTGNSINITPGTKAFFTAFNNSLYFQATDGTSGYELWKSDGTPSGTSLVKDIQIGSASSLPSGIFSTNTNLFFTANDGTNGIEVWMSDGTSGGTALLKDINPGSASGTATTTTFSRSGNGIIYFTANDGTSGTELWRTLGSSVTTTLIADINIGAGSSLPAGMIIYNNLLYCSANDGTTGIEPWKFDPASLPTTIGKFGKQSSLFEIYPNPCKESFNVKLSDTHAELQIVSTLGQLVYAQKLDGTPDVTVVINTKDLKSGLYFVKIITQKEESTKKLIVN